MFHFIYTYIDFDLYKDTNVFNYCFSVKAILYVYLISEFILLAHDSSLYVIFTCLLSPSITVNTNSKQYNR